MRPILIFAPAALVVLDVLFSWTQLLTTDVALARVVLLALWMVLWWVFEVLPLGVTALIPLVYLPALKLLPLKDLAGSYGNPVIFLFLGGFVIARGLEKTELSRRLALMILRLTGRSDRGIVLGFVIATAFLSMWISNTATTVMMVPIALSVIEFLRKNLSAEGHGDLRSMSTVLFLSIAYAANVGGIATPIGTPPNVVFVGYLDELYQQKIDFWRWMVITVPIAVTVLTVMVLVLNRLFPYRVGVPVHFPKFVKEQLTQIGPLNPQQKITLGVFFLVCFLWVMKDVIHLILGVSFLNDTSIAIVGAILLFVFSVLDSEDIAYLPWNIVLLFGGGIALASAMESVGLIQLLTQFFSGFNFSSSYLLIFVLAAMILALTEIMSNVALCVVALPVLMNLGVAQGIDPILIALPATLCSSFAFSMPISTPPNAIIFGTNQVRVVDMLKGGVLLNIFSVIIVMTIGWVLLRALI